MDFRPRKFEIGWVCNRTNDSGFIGVYRGEDAEEALRECTRELLDLPIEQRREIKTPLSTLIANEVT